VRCVPIPGRSSPRGSWQEAFDHGECTPSACCARRVRAMRGGPARVPLSVDAPSCRSVPGWRGSGAASLCAILAAQARWFVAAPVARPSPQQMRSSTPLKVGLALRRSLPRPDFTYLSAPRFPRNRKAANVTARTARMLAVSPCVHKTDDLVFPATRRQTQLLVPRRGSHDERVRFFLGV